MTDLAGEHQSGREHQSAGGHQSPRIVVGVDGSEPSREALRWAVRQAEATGSSVEAIMTWQLPTAAYGFGMPMPTANDFAPYCDKALHDVVQEVAGEHPSVEVSEVVTEGDARQALVTAAHGADLLVVGSRGHGEVAGILLGSVSEYCTTHATCPVVVIRHGRDAAVRTREPATSSPARA